MNKKKVAVVLLGLLLSLTGCLPSNEPDAEPVQEEMLEPGAVKVEDVAYQLPNSQIQGLYTGPMKDGVPVGTGRFAYDDTYNTVYVGTWDQGVPNGLGTYEWKDGDRYVGEVLEGRLHGYGKYIYKSGVEHEGKFENGVLMPDRTYLVGEQAPVGEYLVTLQNVIPAENDQGRILQVQLLIENKFVNEINTAHCLNFWLWDGTRNIEYSNLTTPKDLYTPLILDENMELTATFEGLDENAVYELHYDFDTIGTGTARFSLETETD